MGVSWPFVVLLAYPALQLPMLYLVVRYVGLRNDDGPDDPRGYSFHEEEGATDAKAIRQGCHEHSGRCERCGRRVDEAWTYCEACLSGGRPG